MWYSLASPGAVPGAEPIMEYAYLEKILQTAYLSDKGVPIFRPNAKNNQAVWHKPVPKFDGWYFLDYHWAAPEHIMPVLELSQYIEPDTDPRDPRFQEVQRTVEAERYIGMMTDEEHKVSKRALIKVRERAIDAAVRRLKMKFGTEDAAQVEAIVSAVARMFDVSPTLVKKASGMIEKPKPKEVPRYKEHENYRHLRWAVSQTRAMAYNLDTYSPPGVPKAYGKFEPGDALVPYRKDKLYPEICQVLGTVLSYDRFSVEGKAKGAIARIGRLDTDKPFEAGNIVLMSTTAVQLIEGVLDPATISVDFAERWERWKNTHNVAALRPRNRGGRPKGARAKANDA